MRGISSDNSQPVGEEQPDDEVQLDDGFLGRISSEEKQDNPWLVKLLLHGTEVKFHIDTGAEETGQPIHGTN